MSGRLSAAASTPPHHMERAPPPMTEILSMVAPASMSPSRPSANAKATPSSTAWPMAAASESWLRPNSTPRACGSLCGVRSPDRYGRKISGPSSAARFSTFDSSSAASLVPVSFTAQSTQDAARQHHAHLVPHARQAVAERVHGLGGIRQEFRRDQEQHARGAERQERIAGLDDADARGARGVVAAAAGHRHGVHAPVRGDFLAQRARDVRAFDEARHVRFVEARGGQHLGRPAALAHVQPERAGGVGQSLAFSPVISRRT